MYAIIAFLLAQFFVHLQSKIQQMQSRRQNLKLISIKTQYQLITIYK